MQSKVKKRRVMLGDYNMTAKPKKTLPQRAASVMLALGAKTPAAAPPWVEELAPVSWAPPKPVRGILLVPEGVAEAVDMVAMEELPLYGDWAPQGWSALHISH
jgi:hypothetical protein